MPCRMGDIKVGRNEYIYSRKRVITAISTCLVAIYTKHFGLTGLDQVNSTLFISSVEQFSTTLIGYEIKNAIRS